VPPRRHREDRRMMLTLSLRYARYALSTLGAVGFGIIN
jgi:hypothetical protein